MDPTTKYPSKILVHTRGMPQPMQFAPHEFTTTTRAQDLPGTNRLLFDFRLPSRSPFCMCLCLCPPVPVSPTLSRLPPPGPRPQACRRSTSGPRSPGWRTASDRRASPCPTRTRSTPTSSSTSTSTSANNNSGPPTCHRTPPPPQEHPPSGTRKSRSTICYRHHHIYGCLCLCVCLCICYFVCLYRRVCVCIRRKGANGGAGREETRSWRLRKQESIRNKTQSTSSQPRDYVIT